MPFVASSPPGYHPVDQHHQRQSFKTWQRSIGQPSIYDNMSSAASSPLEYPLVGQYHQRQQPSIIGKASPKHALDNLLLGAVLCSLACLALSICVVLPELPLAWYLGYDDQIVIIGFLLSAMNLCMKNVLQRMLLILEHRCGRSMLQNYDAILRNTILLSKTAFLWRVIIAFFIVLPIGLSVAYKKSTGGLSNKTINSDYPGNYSLTPPPLGGYSRMNNSVYFMTDAIAPFMLAARSDVVKPDLSAVPLAYGYNILLLGQSSAASLDMPANDYILSIRSNLTKDEAWYLTASVQAIVATQDTSIETRRDDDDFWQAVFDWNYSPTGDGGFTSWNTFNHGYRIGLTTGKPTLSDGAPCFLGAYQGSTARLSFTANATAPESLAFRNTSLMFNVRREQCTGTWRVNSTSIELQSGSCTTNSPIAQNILVSTDGADAGARAPYTLDALPVLGHTLDIYTGDGIKSPWRLPAYATSVATMYWARLAFEIGNGAIGGGDDTINYPAVAEHVTSTRPTLDTKWYLYLVLAIQPGLVLLAFTGVTFFYSSPFTSGFGMVAILSGIDREDDGLDSVKGAALSGELKKRVTLGIKTSSDGAKGYLRYTINPDSKGKARVKMGTVYE